MKKNRSTLKDYFKKGAIPTEANFADLIDSMLNQEEDAIAKLPNDPLKITAIGVDEALINFYRIEKNEEKLSWQVKQKPGGKSGLSIADTTSTRLFIENATGSIGVGTTTPKQLLDVRGKMNIENGVIQRGGDAITETSDLGLYSRVDKNWIRIVTTNAPIRFFTDGTVGSNAEFSIEPGYIHTSNKLGIGTSSTPIAKLDIAQDTRSGSHPTAVKGLYVTGNFGDSSDGVEFRNTNSTQGIGFGNNTIYATGSNANQDLGLKPRGTGKVSVVGPMQVTGTLQVTGAQIQLDGNQKIAFADSDTTNNLKVQLWTGYGLGINGSTLFYAANGNHSWRDSNGTNERMLLTTGADGGLTVKGTGGITVGSLVFKSFTTNETDEWPNFAWYRDTAANWDEGLIKGSPSRGKFARAGFGIHMHQSRQFSVFSTGWDSLLAVEGGTGNTFIKGYLAAKQVYFSAYVDLNSRSGALNPLPMQVASQNVGGGYDTGTSTFTAPVKGIYLFTMTASKAEKDDTLNWFLLINGGNANAGGTSTSESNERALISMNSTGTTTSRTVLLALNSGDKVTIKQEGTGRVDNFRSGLEGVLLYATM